MEQSIKNATGKAVLQALQKEFDALGEFICQTLVHQEKVISGYLYLKLKPFEIQNELGAKHKIIDLMCRFKFRMDFYEDNTFKFYLIDFTGKRLKMTKQEILASYQHSHLQDNYKLFTPFCMGQGPLALWMYKMKKDPNYVWQANELEYPAKAESTSNSTLKAEFTHFRMLLTKYLVWESISGVPHKLINELKAFNVNKASDNSFPDMKFEDFYKYAKEMQLHYFQRAFPKSKETMHLNEILDMVYYLNDFPKDHSFLKSLLDMSRIEHKYPIISILETLQPLSEKERINLFRDPYSFPLEFDQVLDLYEILQTMSQSLSKTNRFLYNLMQGFLYLVECDDNGVLGKYIISPRAETTIFNPHFIAGTDESKNYYDVGSKIPCEGLNSKDYAGVNIKTDKQVILSPQELSVLVIENDSEENVEKTSDLEKENQKRFKFYLNPIFLQILLEDFRKNLNISNVDHILAKNVIWLLRHTIEENVKLKDVQQDRTSEEFISAEAN